MPALFVSPDDPFAGACGATGAGPEAGREMGAEPATAAEALAMVQAGLSFLVGDDPAGQPSAVVAERLIGLEEAARRMCAARAAALAALEAGRGFEDDGQSGLRPWQKLILGVDDDQARRDGLRARRLREHPRLWQALAEAAISPSIADRILAWVARLPREVRAWACAVLTDTARIGGVSEADLIKVAGEMLRRARPEPGDDGSGNHVTVAATVDGVGRINGSLSADTTELVTMVLAALGKRQGPDDGRSTGERHHDALREAMARLVDSGMLPEAAGRKPRIEATLDLAALRRLPGAEGAELAWTRTRSAWLAHALSCDAGIQGIVTAHPVGPARLITLTHALIDTLTQHGWLPPAHPAGPSPVPAPPPPHPSRPDAQHPNAVHTEGPCPRTDRTQAGGQPPGAAGPGATRHGTSPGPAETSTVRAAAKPAAFDALPAAEQAALIEELLAWAAEALSGPAGLGSCLRATLNATLTTPGSSRVDDNPTHHGDRFADGLTGGRSASAGSQGYGGQGRGSGQDRGEHRCGSGAECGDGEDWDITATAEVARVLLAATRGKSLILDVSDPEDAVPYRLRRAVELRDGRCRWPGCDTPATRAQAHHIIERHDGGPSTMANLVLLCARHHLHFVHRLGWTIRLNADASVTVTSPTGKTLHNPAPTPPHQRR
ncbi:HNH endonuclease [Planotetraspora sp. A-T 1434]|uniref:HNH endonuclease signature motif containing protein n=1 Tax=Planotetraspora sp. A-T 1434 TaxID=2979219 RepID=UPI0021BFC74D|nr:HNH endonuclease signature motif containing protein [Planotetraspora sp. A-T 1434]MCT9933318.1 HNH endonuclease [Planotetraspora sp. A-T 1434]